MRNFTILVIAACLISSCKEKPKMVTTEHGFKFINYTNKGGQKPQAGDMVLVQTYAHIKDSLMLDTQRDFGGPQESELPETKLLGDKVPAMHEAIMLMSVGDSATVYEPLDSFALTYVPEGLKDAKEVSYTMVLLEITTKKQLEISRKENIANLPKVMEDYTSGKLAGKMKVSPSGVKILVQGEGRGAQVVTGEMLNVNYYGCLKSSGKMFDTSYERGEPVSFITGSGQMIFGFDEAVQQLKHGAKAYLFIPAALGYGNQAHPLIPPNSDLVFYIEIL